MNLDGSYAEQYSFDPWGRRRNPTDWTFNNVPAPTLIDRGYTGHEHLDEFGLINMNGRMYDPVISRFLSVDPIIQSPDNSQTLNGYSYCINNPLKYTDPSGYSMISPYYQFLKDHYGYEGNSVDYRGQYLPWSSEVSNFIDPVFGSTNGLGPLGYYNPKNGKYYHGGIETVPIAPTSDQVFEFANSIAFNCEFEQWDQDNAGGVAYMVFAQKVGVGYLIANRSYYKFYDFFNLFPTGQGGIVGGDLWNSVSNNLNGAGFSVAGMKYSGSRALSRTLAYTNTNSLVKPSQVMFKVPGGSVYTSTKFVSGATKALKVGGIVTGVLGVGITAFEIRNGQKSLIGEGGLDLIMGGVAFIPGGGWVVSGLYFGGKIFLEYTGYDFWNKP